MTVGSPSRTRDEDAIGAPLDSPTLVPAERYYSPPSARSRLIPARVGTWEGLVFVNLDVGAMPLSDYLEAVPDDIAWCRLSDFRCYATLTVEVDANWKTIADGYSETYHIQTLDPELLRCVDDIHAPQQIWGHTGKSDQPTVCRARASTAR